MTKTHLWRNPLSMLMVSGTPGLSTVTSCSTQWSHDRAHRADKYRTIFIACIWWHQDTTNRLAHASWVCKDMCCVMTMHAHVLACKVNQFHTNTQKRPSSCNHLEAPLQPRVLLNELPVLVS